MLRQAQHDESHANGNPEPVEGFKSIKLGF